MNKFILPKDVVDIIKDYTFRRINKIQKNDKRYKMLLSIPYKEYDPNDDVTFVYISINDEKDYYITYANFEVQIQIFMYDDNLIHQIEAHNIIL